MGSQYTIAGASLKAMDFQILLTSLSLSVEMMVFIKWCIFIIVSFTLYFPGHWTLLNCIFDDLCHFLGTDNSRIY